MRGSIYLPLILKIENLNTLKWYVDASYVTNEDFKGHTGENLTMNRDSVESMKKNTKSSTETDIFGINETIP